MRYRHQTRREERVKWKLDQQHTNTAQLLTLSLLCSPSPSVAPLIHSYLRPTRLLAVSLQNCRIVKRIALVELKHSPQIYSLPLLFLLLFSSVRLPSFVPSFLRPSLLFASLPSILPSLLVCPPLFLPYCVRPSVVFRFNGMSVSRARQPYRWEIQILWQE